MPTIFAPPELLSVYAYAVDGSDPAEPLSPGQPAHLRRRRRKLPTRAVRRLPDRRPSERAPQHALHRRPRRSAAPPRRRQGRRVARDHTDLRRYGRAPYRTHRRRRIPGRLTRRSATARPAGPPRQTPQSALPRLGATDRESPCPRHREHRAAREQDGHGGRRALRAGPASGDRPRRLACEGAPPLVRRRSRPRCRPSPCSQRRAQAAQSYGSTGWTAGPVAPEAEVARVKALLSAARFGDGLEQQVLSLVDDRTQPWLQVEKQRLNTKQLAAVPRLGGVQMSAIDPGLARFLGFVGRVDAVPDLDTGEGWFALAVVGLIAIDPGPRRGSRS